MLHEAVPVSQRLFFPGNYGGPTGLTDSFSSGRWYFGKMGRKDAERILLSTGNQRGTFLARESETTKGKKTKGTGAAKPSYAYDWLAPNAEKALCNTR